MNRLLGIGISGLRAHQQAIGTTGHNIANANVEGYSRQRVELATQSSPKLGAGYPGSGVQVTDIRRVVDEFLVEQLRLDTSSFHAMKTMADHYGELDSLLANASTGLAPAMQEMFASLQQASQDPTSLEVRQVVLNSAGNLAQRFNSLHGALENQQRGINRQLDALAGQVTALAEGLATVNRALAERHPSGEFTGRPNALLDERDSLLQELSELVSIQVTTQSSGAVNVFIGNGQPLVVGEQAGALRTAPSTLVPGQQELVFSTGELHQVVSPFIKGGSLGGLLDYRRESLEPAFDQLGRIAINLAWDFNAQQRSGLDLDGDPGQNLFADVNHPEAMRDRAAGATTNEGNARLAVAITDPGNLATGSYQLQIDGGDQYRLVRLGDGQQVAGGDLSDLEDLEIDGFALSLAEGSFQEGDRFLIAPTRTGASNLQSVMRAPEELAFAQPLRGRADAGNRGSGSLEVTAWESVQPPVRVEFTSAHTFDVLDLSNPSHPVPLDGLQGLGFTPDSATPVTIRDPDSQELLYRFELGGRPAAGDGFTVEPNALGSSDNRNALALAELREQPGIGGRQDYESAYGLLVEQVGSRTAELKINRDAADTLVTQTRSQRDAVSGVNLDEEAANLIRFEQAYNASAQVINIARTLFDSLLMALR